MASQTTPGGSDVPLRERKRLLTRRAILEAVCEIELFGGGALDTSAITYARIADVAGVSERTVYRFFPTKADLDEAYATDMPVMLGLEPPEDYSVDAYPDVIEAIGKRWDDRTDGRRVDEQEIDADLYPISMGLRRARDAALVDQMMDLAPNSTGLNDRQRVALTAAIHSALSIRSIAITAQRWNLSIGEAARAHAWAGRTLLKALAESTPEPWENTDD